MTQGTSSHILQHDVNNDQNHLCIGYILNYFIVKKRIRKNQTKISGI
jgi:hypothetical protein